MSSSAMSNLSAADPLLRKDVPDAATKAAELRPRAEAGEAEAQFQLGELYDDPSNGGSPEAVRIALSWYEKAGAQGHVQGANCSGYVLLNGLAGAPDHARAMALLQPIADKGDSWAAQQIAESYERGQGTAVDLPTAVTWYRRAAQAGAGFAMYRLGYNLANGRGVERNAEEAVRWFRAAADKEISAARACLAAHHLHGIGVELDYAAAADWCRKAQETRGGNTWAPFLLGVMSENGLGTPRDMEAAIRFYLASAQARNGHYHAKVRCNILNATGLSHIPRFDADPQWLQAGAENGEIQAMYLLALSLQYGVGLEKNPGEALAWLILAAASQPLPAVSEARDTLRAQLASDQIAQAERLAEERRQKRAGEPPRMF